MNLISVLLLRSGKEIEYFLPGILDLDKFNIRPVLDWEFNEMYKIDPVLSDFDLADQSLFIMGKSMVK